MRIQQIDNPRMINEWNDAVNALTVQVSGWATDQRWSVERSEKQVNEGAFGVYQLPVLTLEIPARRRSSQHKSRQGGRLIMEPIARNFPGSGIIELYAYPTLYRVRLIRRSEDDTWEVLTDSGITLHQEWNKANFVTLADDLLAAGR